MDSIFTKKYNYSRFYRVVCNIFITWEPANVTMVWSLFAVQLHLVPLFPNIPGLA